MHKISFLIIILSASFSSIYGQASGNAPKAAGNLHYDESPANVYYSNHYANNSQTDGVQPIFSSDNTMEFEISGLANIAADSYVAMFNLTQLGETAQNVDELCNNRILKFKSSLLALGITEKDVFVDMLSLVPIYEYEVEKKLFSKSYNEVPAGFELQKNVHVRYSKGDVLDKILTAAASCEIYDIIKVDYFVNDQAQVYDQLRTKSMEALNRKTSDFKKIGVRLDSVYHIVAETRNVSFPIEHYSRYQAFSSQSLDVAKKKNQVSQLRKPQTQYYNKVGYNNYDVVINPVVLEPVVQFTYHLKVKYILKDPMPKVIKQYYLLTPNGTLQYLDIPPK